MTGCASCGEENNGDSNSQNVQIEPDTGGDMGIDSDAGDTGLDGGDEDATTTDMDETDPPTLVIQPTELLLRPGEMTPLDPYIEFGGERLDPEAITYSIDDETVATVNADGEVTAGADEGAATITAQTTFEMTELSIDVPISVTGPYVDLAAGRAHTCAVSALGGVFCWGDNDKRQTGVDADEAQPMPRKIAVGMDAFSIGAGLDHTCAVDMGGTVLCWGSNDDGQLGAPASDPVVTPVTALMSDVVEVGGGIDFTCARDAAPPVPTGEGGTIWCWGSNDDGQLGSNTGGTPSDSPLEVDLPDAVFIDLAVGDSHACGVTYDGETYCWGSNDAAQLGPSPMTSSSTPVLVSDAYRRVWAGGTRTCGRTGAGVIECWGTADSGLGDASETTTSGMPVVVEAPMDVTLDGVALGVDHGCATATQGGTYCWGTNEAGQLGDSTTESHATPAQVVNNPSYSEVRAGYDHTCAIAQMGDAFCWGANEVGQLGDGTTLFKRRPTAARPPR